MSLSAPQCRAARAILGISQDDLAQRSKVAKATIANFEAGNRRPYDRTLDDLRRALEAAGVEFIPENGGGAGVRLARSGKPAPSLSDRIERLEHDIADIPAAGSPSPESGMNRMRKAVAENDLTDLKNERTKLGHGKDGK